MQAGTIQGSDEQRGQMPRALFGYEIIAPVGEGAGSLIYVATEPKSGQLCALKHVVVRTDRDQRFVDQLKGEYEVGRKVADAHLRRCLDLKVKANWLGKVSEAALIMELVDGVPLDRQCPRSVLDVVDCFAQVAHGLHALHTLGYVHCDLKPANILWCAGNVAKVIDLGQACPVGTKKERIQGTPDYIAPEQVKREAVTPRTDVFNLGASMYWCLTGQKMPTLFTVQKSDNSFLVDTAIPSPHDLKPSIAENLSNLIMDCVRIRADKRPADMADVARRLEVIHFGMERHPVAV
jgi:eukaryotic-like serine/threonine-protein kinase